MAGKRDITLNVGYNVDDKQLKASFSELKKSLQDIQNMPLKNFAGTQDDLIKVKDTAKQVEKLLTEAFNPKINSVNVDKFNQSLQKSGMTLSSVQADFAKIGTQGNIAFEKLATSVLTSNLQLRQTHSLLDRMGTTMMNTVKWGVASSIFNTITSSVQQAFQYVKSLDSALTDIRIVTGDSAQQMSNFADQANRAAKQLGRSTMEYSKAALTFYQQGLSDQDVQARAQATLMAQNITGAGSQMADYLTAVWNGYKVANQEAELYVDKLAAVADSSASNMSQLAVAMSKVAATANALGVPVDSLNAQIATIVATTRQAPESVGNALKTIYSRINDISTGADQAQISLGNYSEKMAQLGFNVLDASGHLRDTGDVIEQIGGKWEYLSREQQIYLARTMAGQRQYNNLIALFDNWSKYTDLVTVSMDSQGATMEKNSRYMESIEAHMNQLSVAQERLKSSLIDSDSFKGLIDIGTGAVQFISNFIESIGGGGNALLALGSIATQVFSGTIAKQISGVITNFQNADYNLKQLQADIRLTKEFGSLDGLTGNAIEEVVKLKTQIKDYYGVMSTQQINQYQGIVRSVGQLKVKQQQFQRLAQAAKQAQSVIDRQTQFKWTQNIDGELTKVKTSFEDFIAGLKNNEALIRFSIDGKSPDEAFDVVWDKFNYVRGKINNDKLILNVEGADKIKELYENSTRTTQSATELNRVFQVFLDNLQKIDPSKYKQLIAEIQKTNTELEIAKTKAQQFKNAIANFAQVKTITTLIGSVGSLASGFSALNNVWKNVINNDKLSTSEKILQTMTGLGSAATMLYSSFSRLNGILKITETLKIAFGRLTKEEITALFGQAGAIGGVTAARYAQASAIQKVNIAMAANPYGAVAIAIAGVVAAIAAAVKIYDHFTMSTKQAQQAIQNFSKKQQQLNSNLKNYKSDQSILESGQWQELSKKVGAYGANIDRLTEDQKARYFQLTNIVAKYNQDAISGYDQQGNAILKNNSALEQTIRLLEDKRQAEIDSTYGSQEFKQARKGDQQLYKDAKRNVESRDTKNTISEQQYRGAFDSTIQYLYSYGDRYKDAIEELKKIEDAGAENYIAHQVQLQNILNTIPEVDLPNPFKEAFSDFNNMSDYFDQAQDKLQKFAKFNMSYLFGELQTSNNKEYYSQAKQNGATALDSIITGFVDGLDANAVRDSAIQSGYEDVYQYIIDTYLNGQNGIISRLNEALYTPLEKFGGESLEKVALNTASITNNLKDSISQFSREGLIEGSMQNVFNQLNDDIKSVLTNPEQDPQMRQALLDYFANIFNVDGLTFDNGQFEVVDKAVDGLRNRIQDALNKKGDDFGLSFDEDTFQKLLPNDLSDQQVDHIKERFLQLIQTTNDWRIALAQSVKEQMNVAEASNALGSFSAINKIATGEVKAGTKQYEQLQTQIRQLTNDYPQLTNAVKILNDQQLQGTAVYKKALQEVNLTLLDSLKTSVQNGSIAAETVVASLKSVINTTELLQATQGKGLLTGKDYQDTLIGLANNYESCKNEIDAYASALASGNEQAEKAARNNLQVATRAAQAGQTYGLTAERISETANRLRQFSQAGQQGYQGLAKNNQLLTDTAVAYLRLNDGIYDINSNLQKYKQVMLQAAESGVEAVRSTQQMSNSFDNLKQSVANMLNTDVGLLSDTFVVDNLENIIAAAQGSQEALRNLQQAATDQAWDHLIKIGVDQYYLEDTLYTLLDGAYSSVADWANNLPEGELSVDDTAFLNTLVWAMQQAGMAADQIQRNLGQMGIDVDLVPYEQGLARAVEAAAEAGGQMVDNLAMDAQVTQQQNDSTDNKEFSDLTYQTVPMDVHYLLPKYSGAVVPGMGYIPHVQMYDYVGSIDQIIASPKKDSVDVTSQTTAVALTVKNARKRSGGNISRSAKTGKSSGKKSGGSGGKKSGGSGKSSTPKASTPKQPQVGAKITNTNREKGVQAQKDPYHDINIQLEKQEQILDQLQRKDKETVPRDRLEVIQQQNKQLEKQKELLLQKSNIAGSELVRLRNEIIAALGDAVVFDSDGSIANWNEAFQAAADQYNARVDQYNANVAAKQAEYNKWVAEVYDTASAQQQETLKKQLDSRKQAVEDYKKVAKEQLDGYKQHYDDTTKAIQEYQKTLELQDDIAKRVRQIIDQQIQDNIAQTKVKVDLSIDAGDFEREWLEFDKKFLKKIDASDHLGNARYIGKEIDSYLNSDQLSNTRNQIAFIQSQIAQIQAGGTSSVYGDHLETARKDLEEYMKKYMGDLQKMQDLVEDIREEYLDTIDDAKDKMDDQIDQYNRVGDIIQHNIKLTELMYGDKAYDSMNKYYDLQHQNDEKALQSLYAQQQYWQEKMNQAVQGSEAWEKFKKNYEDATDGIYNKMQDMIGKLREKFENQLNAAIDKVNNKLTNGLGTGYLDKQWDLSNQFDDDFLDTFESKMGIDQISRLYQSAVDDAAGNPKLQSKMNELMKDQLKVLKEKDHLTQYDLDRAKASLEVEKARYALEDSRNSKTQMRLRRDSQGNYTYQYVADEEKLTDLQSALADAQANLYNMDKQHYQQNLNKMYNTYKNYLEDMAELQRQYNNTQDEEERERIKARMEMIKEKYDQYFGALSEDQQYTISNLSSSFADGMGLDKSLFTDSQWNTILTENIPMYGEGIHNLYEQIVGEGGLIPATADAVQEMANAVTEFDQNAKAVFDTVEMSVEGVKQAVDAEGNAIDKNIQQTEKLITSNEALMTNVRQTVQQIEEYLTNVEQYVNGLLNVNNIAGQLGSAFNTNMSLMKSDVTTDTVNNAGMYGGLNPDDYWQEGTTEFLDHMKAIFSSQDFVNMMAQPMKDAILASTNIDALRAQGGAQGMYTSDLADQYYQQLMDREMQNALAEQQKLQMESMEQAMSLLNDNLSNIASAAASGYEGRMQQAIDQQVQMNVTFPNVTSRLDEIEESLRNLVNRASQAASTPNG